MFKCQQCKEKFEPKNNYAAGQKPKYCSGKCKAAAWRKQNPQRFKEICKTYADKNSPKHNYKACSVCQKEIPFDRKGPGIQTCSKQCSKNRKQELASITRKNKVDELRHVKELVGCACCGYSRYGGSLDFHHVNPSEKDVKEMNYGGSRKFKEEVAKCVLVCKNCHRELHHLMKIDLDQYNKMIKLLPRASLVLEYLDV